MYRVRTVFTGMQGAPWLSTAYFDQSGGTAQQAVTAIGAFWGAVDALIDSEVDWATEADVSEISAVNGALTGVESTTPVTGTGSSVGDALPLATQALVRWRTGLIVEGREVRGRTFIPALVEASNDNGNLLAASRTTIQTAADTLIASANAQFVVWSKTHGLGPDAIAATVAVPFAFLGSRRD